jgi:hypothetical protein
VLCVDLKEVRVAEGRVSERIVLNVPPGEGTVGEGGRGDRTFR